MAALLGGPTPLFRAVANSARPIFHLLRCINFSPKVHVQISEEGIRFTADHSRVMQGSVFLDKDLFATYNLNLEQTGGGPTEEANEADGSREGGSDPSDLPIFQISLVALLETLQIFGAVDVAARAQRAEQDGYRSNLRNYNPDVFSHQSLGISGTCCLVYLQEGDPFGVVMEEAGVKTSANLRTYLPEMMDDIPFDRENLAFKIIMQARHLHDTLTEVAITGPEKVRVVASRTSPFLAFSSAGGGDLGGSGGSSVDFSRGRDLLETFSISEARWTQTYKFELLRGATEAMRIGSKVAFRGDSQGVLSWNFMVEMDGGGRSFVNFKFVPYAPCTDDDDDDGGDDGADSNDAMDDDQQERGYY